MSATAMTPVKVRKPAASCMGYAIYSRADSSSRVKRNIIDARNSREVCNSREASNSSDVNNIRDKIKSRNSMLGLNRQGRQQQRQQE
jgi:hypothetical protein